MSIDRRQFVLGTGIALAGAVGIGTNVLADEHEISVVIAAVNPPEETVVLENTGSEDIDLTGYQIDWEHRNDNDTQINAFPDGVSIGAGAQLVVWSGFQSSEIPDVEADVTMRENVGDAPSDALINDDGNDVIALLSPGGEAVATSDEDGGDGGDGGDDDSSGEDDDGDGGDEDDGTDTDGEGDDEPVEEEDGDADEDEDDEEPVEEADEETDEDDC